MTPLEARGILNVSRFANERQVQSAYATELHRLGRRPRDKDRQRLTEARDTCLQDLRRQEAGPEVPERRFFDFHPPGWRVDPWAPRGCHTQHYQRWWGGHREGWTKRTRVTAGWLPAPDSSGYEQYWNGERWTDERRPPSPDCCSHPRKWCKQRYDRRLSCRLCGYLGPCPHLHTRTWSGPTIGASWECYDCGVVYHAQTIPAPGTPGNPGF